MTAPVASTAIGLFGKLPAHGDFVRRGGPAAVFAAIDRWIEAEARSTADLAAFDGLRILFLTDTRPTLATAIASEDAVGRAFPAFALVTGDRQIEGDAAEAWCGAAGSALAVVRDADAAYASLSAIDPPPSVPEGAVARWWRAGGAGDVFSGNLPRGPAFAAMLATAA